jgi:hypothetical protein
VHNALSCMTGISAPIKFPDRRIAGTPDRIERTNGVYNWALLRRAGASRDSFRLACEAIIAHFGSVRLVQLDGFFWRQQHKSEMSFHKQSKAIVIQLVYFFYCPSREVADGDTCSMSTLCNTCPFYNA